MILWKNRNAHKHKDAENAVNLFCEEHLQGCLDFEKLMLSGDPAPAILKTIDSIGIDLVVMGSHGRKGLEETIFGSVAENVLKKSPVPVLTVNPYRLNGTPAHWFITPGTHIGSD